MVAEHSRYIRRSQHGNFIFFTRFFPPFVAGCSARVGCLGTLSLFKAVLVSYGVRGVKAARRRCSPDVTRPLFAKNLSIFFSQFRFSRAKEREGAG